MLKWLKLRLEGAPISIFHEFKKPPYGGGNQFLLALRAEWQRNGFDVGANRVGKKTRAVLFNSYNFNFDELRRIERGSLRMIHRVDGPISVYRGGRDLEIDQKICQVNSELADATIFQSRYSLLKHQEMGLEFRNPTVISNAVDSSIFHRPLAPRPRAKNAKVKVIASAWSDNPKKGAATYQWLDQHLDRSRYEFTFVGRIKVPLENSRVIPAVPSHELAELLREQDIYITASEHDTCSNAVIEALSCGLPVVYLNSGGHPELVKDAGLPFEKPDEIPALLDRIAADYEAFRARIKVNTIVEIARQYLEVMEIR